MCNTSAPNSSAGTVHIVAPRHRGPRNAALQGPRKWRGSSSYLMNCTDDYPIYYVPDSGQDEDGQEVIPALQGTHTQTREVSADVILSSVV